MYFPYLRGKQFELIAIREIADKCKANFYRPIIEPVRYNLSPLIKTIKHLNARGVSPLIIINPTVGDYKNDESELLTALNSEEEIDYLPCIKLKDSTDAASLQLIEYTEKPFAIQIINGVDQAIIKYSQMAEYTIVNSTGTPPQALVRLKNPVLIGDFFQKKSKNSEYPNESSYSHLHATFKTTGNAVGFSDYTILPEEFIEGGGPAYVVTIHSSYINEKKFDEMYVRHYSSTDDKSPTNPAGKFIEALSKLMHDYEGKIINFEDTCGMEDFTKLNHEKHFPGLGQVKKISIKHHIETLCIYLEKSA